VVFSSHEDYPHSRSALAGHFQPLAFSWALTGGTPVTTQAASANKKQ
jgi:hypothetical protein